MRDDDDASAHALFSCPLFDGKKFKRDDGETLTRQKRRRTCVAMVEKFPEYAVYSAKMVLVRSLRVAATNAYMSGMTRCVAHRKKMRTKRKAPPSLFFPTKAERNSIQIERIIRRESETNLKSTTLHESNKKKKNGGGGGRGGYAHGQTQKKKTKLVVVALLLSIDSTSGVPIEIDVPFARRGPRPVLTHAGGREVHLIPFIAIEIIAQSAVERVFYVLFVLTVKIVTVARFAVGGGSSWVELDVEDRVS